MLITNTIIQKYSKLILVLVLFVISYITWVLVLNQSPKTLVFAIFLLFTPLLFTAFKSKHIITILFFLQILYFDFLPRSQSLSLILLPFFLTVLFTKKIMQKKTNFGFIISKTWPFLLYFSIGLYWFTQKGMMPSIITGTDKFGKGNFTLYYNIFLNLISLLLPFFIPINNKQIIKLFKLFFYFFLIKSVLFIFSYGLNYNFYIPIFMPVPSTRFSAGSGELINRIGEISQASYMIIMYYLFFIKTKKSKTDLFVIGYAIAINLIWGGGRAALLSESFVIIYYYMFSQERGKERLKRIGKFILILFVLIILFFQITQLFPKKQISRFDEIFNPTQTYDKKLRDDNSRITMWKYAIKEFKKSPAIGNGIGNLFRYSDYKKPAYRNVASGGAHNKYISILYSFGLLGLILFIIGSIKLFYNLKKNAKHDVLYSFLICYFLVTYLINFNLGGGIKSLSFMFYFLIGFVMSNNIKKNNENIAYRP